MPVQREAIPGAAQAPAGSGAAEPVASVAVRGGAFLFFSGMTALDAEAGARSAGTTAGETRLILERLQAQLAAAGSSLERVVKVTVLLDDMREAPNMNEVYARYFPEPPPARTVCGACLPPGVKVMIECTALA